MKDESFKDFVLDQLVGLPGVSVRRMFGGYGLYRGKAFFGIVFKGRLFFKTDDSSRLDYESHRMQPFQPNARQTLKSYFEVPAEIIENSQQLIKWAEKAAQL